MHALESTLRRTGRRAHLPLRQHAAVGLLLGWVVAGGWSLVRAAEPDGAPVLLPADGPTEKEYPALHSLFQITERIYSGGEPVGPDAFESLARLGIKTIVSVDGAQPNVAEAKKHGLRYVHIPIGYDGVSTNAGLAFTRLVNEVEGPIYFHCHHGTHRGPAAAAVACIAAGDATPQSAIGILRKAGTGTNYVGLWRDVAAFTQPRPDVALPELVEVAKVGSMVAAMASIDRAMDNLKLCRDAGWGVPPGHPDVVPKQEALLLKEALRETGRTLAEDQDERFRQWLAESEQIATQLEADLQALRLREANTAMERLSQSCSRCHKAYRN